MNKYSESIECQSKHHHYHDPDEAGSDEHYGGATCTLRWRYVDQQDGHGGRIGSEVKKRGVRELPRPRRSGSGEPQTGSLARQAYQHVEEPEWV